MAMDELTLGGLRNNHYRILAYCPQLMKTEVEYCNTFALDPPTFRREVH